MYTIETLDNEKKNFKTDADFISFTNRIREENEDADMQTDTIEKALFYIRQFCGNLTLTINT